MDKILLVDYMNNIYRANVNFGKQDHKICYLFSKDGISYTENTASDFECNHKLKQIVHCTCGQSWNEQENKCTSQPPPEHTIIYSFFRNLRPLVELFSPDKIFFVLEGHPQFRYDLFAGYKSNRKIIKESKSQEELDKIFNASNEITKFLQYLPVTIVRALHYECDDVISTLCKNMKDDNITILSNDSDYIQLLQDQSLKRTRIYNPIKKEFMQAPLYPYVIWKCLNGDKSDSIPALLNKSKAVSYTNSPELFKKFMSIEENRANFNINRELIEFKNVPESEMIFIEGIENFSLLKEKFMELKFESITNDKSWKKFSETFNCIKY